MLYVDTKLDNKCCVELTKILIKCFSALTKRHKTVSARIGLSLPRKKQQ
jgi:hypothetical protein